MSIRMEPKEIAQKIAITSDMLHDQTLSTSHLFNEKIVKELIKIDPFRLNKLMTVVNAAYYAINFPQNPDT